MEIILIDGHALAYRAYYAFVRNPLINSKGENTSAVYGFTRVILQILNKFEPRRIAVAFDSEEETERHRQYGEYKAHRKEMPEDMVTQLPLIEKMMEALGIPTLECPGYEADDIIATVARKAESQGMDVKIISGDKDLYSLLSERVHMIKPSRGGELESEITPEDVKEKYGLEPEQMVDFLSLMGDSSDNIPGVRGIGEKTALKLLHQFGSVDNIIASIDQVNPPHLRKKLREGSDDLKLSRELVELREVELESPVSDMFMKERNEEALCRLLLDLEFRQIVEELSLAEGREEEAAEHIIAGREEMEEIVKEIKFKGGFVFDTETTSASPHTAELVGISICTSEERAWYIPVSYRRDGSNVQLFQDRKETPGLPLDVLNRELGPVFRDSRIKKAAHNIKYDVTVLERHGFTVQGSLFDTMIASYCINPAKRSHSLDNLVLELYRHRMIPYRELFNTGDRQRDIKSVPLEKLSHYACEDAEYTLKLKKRFQPLLESEGVKNLFYNLEMPLAMVLKRMEREGVGLDLERLKELSREVSSIMDGVVEKIYSIAGEKFNINSNKQLQRILFDRLGLKPVRKTKTGFSTDSGVLKELASRHPIAEHLLEYRKLYKLRNTYIDILPALVHPRTGRIHTSYNQTVTATGRLSSSDPNLQNIPIRTELGRKIRSAFIPREGNLFMDADYSQVELRIMAHLSGDESFREAFREGRDIHTHTAARIFDVAEGQVDGNMRARAKTINFGIIYGMGATSLSRQLGIPTDEARRFIDDYFSQYPRVESYIERVVRRARKKGYSETMLGRRRIVPDLESNDSMRRSFSERIAVNTPIQGTAADMIKIAMVNIDREIRRRNLASRMILQVHDELMFDVREDEMEEMKELVYRLMSEALKLDVPVEVDIGTGRNWLEAH